MSDALDAARYRWLKSRQHLVLWTEHSGEKWTRPGGTKFRASHFLVENRTRHAPAEGLDATIDAAMIAAVKRDATEAP